MAIVEYMEAAKNKIGLARDHHADLAELRSGEEHERRRIQRAFEDVIGNGISAGDQAAAGLAGALCISLGRNNTPHTLLHVVERSDAARVNHLDPCLDALRAWTEEPIVRDYRERRNLAVHAHYETRPYRPHLTAVSRVGALAQRQRDWADGLDRRVELVVLADESQPSHIAG